MVVASLINALELEKVDKIAGSVTDFEFDYDGNLYGIENVYKIKNYTKTKSKVTFTFFKYQRNSFFFKLDAINKRTEWKIPFYNDNVVIPGNLKNPFLYIFNYIHDEKTRILINRKNDVHFFVEKEELTEVYKPTTIDHHGGSVTFLKRISEYPSWLRIDQAFMVDDDRIIMTGLPDDNTTSSIKLLKLNSGKWLTIASTREKDNSIHLARDTEGNIYFTAETGDPCDLNHISCNVISAMANATATQQLFLLTKDSFQEDDPPKPQVIHGAKTDVEKIINLRINDENVLYIQTFDNSSSIFKIKKMVDKCTFKTIFSQTGEFSTFETFEKEAIIIKLGKEKYRQDEWQWDYGLNYTEFLYGADVMHVTEKRDKIKRLNHYEFSIFNFTKLENFDENRNLPYGPITKEIVFQWDKNSPLITLSDKEGNIYFENTEEASYDQKPALYLYDNIDNTVSEIKFEPFADYFTYQYYRKILLDGKENLWILNKKLDLGAKPDNLFYLKKGTTVAKKVLSSQNILKIGKSSNREDVFIATDSGLFLIQ